MPLHACEGGQRTTPGMGSLLPPYVAGSELMASAFTPEPTCQFICMLLIRILYTKRPSRREFRDLLKAHCTRWWKHCSNWRSHLRRHAVNIPMAFTTKHLPGFPVRVLPITIQVRMGFIIAENEAKNSRCSVPITNGKTQGLPPGNRN